MTPLEQSKWLKCSTNVKNIVESSKMSKMHPKRRQQPQKLLKWPKYEWNLKNKEDTHKTSENDQNTPKLSQNTLDFLDFGGILVGFKFLRSF